MQFKNLEWKDVVSDNVIISSVCKLNICGQIKMEFQINHEPVEDKYILYAFGQGNIRRLGYETYGSIEAAKNTAYRIYNNEMLRIRKTIEYMLE